MMIVMGVINTQIPFLLHEMTGDREREKKSKTSLIDKNTINKTEKGCRYSSSYQQGEEAKGSWGLSS